MHTGGRIFGRRGVCPPQQRKTRGPQDSWRFATVPASPGALVMAGLLPEHDNTQRSQRMGWTPATAGEPETTVPASHSAFVGGGMAVDVLPTRKIWSPQFLSQVRTPFLFSHKDSSLQESLRTHQPCMRRVGLSKVQHHKFCQPLSLWMQRTLRVWRQEIQLHDVTVELDRQGFVGRPAWVELELGARPPPSLNLGNGHMAGNTLLLPVLSTTSGRALCCASHVPVTRPTCNPTLVVDLPTCCMDAPQDQSSQLSQNSSAL